MAPREGQSSRLCRNREVISGLILSLQLFVLNYTAPVDLTVPWSLQLARYLAASVAFSAIFATIARVFFGGFKRVRVKFYRDHVILCGLGRRGVGLVASLRDRGHQVVVIEPDERHAGLVHCRALGVIVLTGNSSEPWMLDMAGVKQATSVLALSESDGLNIEAAMLTHDMMPKDRKLPLHCVSQVSDVNLRKLVRDHEAFQGGKFEFQAFHLYEVAARLMVREATLLLLEAKQVKAPVILIVGFGLFGETLLLRAAKDWWHDRPDVSIRMRAIVVGRDASNRMNQVYKANPWLDTICDVFCDETDILYLDCTKIECLDDLSLSMAFVCLNDDRLAVHVACTLQEIYGANDLPISVRMQESGGLSRLFGFGNGPKPICLEDLAGSAALMLNPERELMAQTIHQEYCRRLILLGDTPKSNSSIKAWNDLPEGLKQANRDQAAAIPEKLSMLGYKLVPSDNVEFFQDQFEPDRIEALAEWEHNRWMESAARQGWTYGKVRDNARKKRPEMVPYGDLNENNKEKDRNTIRALPTILGKADYQLIRQS